MFPFPLLLLLQRTLNSGLSYLLEFCSLKKKTKSLYVQNSWILDNGMVTESRAYQGCCEEPFHNSCSVPFINPHHYHLIWRPAQNVPHRIACCLIHLHLQVPMWPLHQHIAPRPISFMVSHLRGPTLSQAFPKEAGWADIGRGACFSVQCWFLLLCWL